MDPDTRNVYDALAANYATARPPVHGERARGLALSVRPGGVILDAGSGTGAYARDLAYAGHPVVGVDASAGMLRVAALDRQVHADLASIPLGDGSVAAAWARNSYLHTPHGYLPSALRELHRVMEVGAPLAASFLASAARDTFISVDDLPGRYFATWHAGGLADVFIGAGFADVRVEHSAGSDAAWVSCTRARSIADTVAPGMRLLVCGLNPSLNAADAGIGFVTAGNRFWPAALAAQLVTADRDPDHALAIDQVGMTDIVKRATSRAASLSAAEYRDGLARVRHLVEWMQPGAVAFVGLAGWRAAVDRRAVAGIQPSTLGGRPVYVLPSTSGANAACPMSDLVNHLKSAADLGDATR